MKELVSRLRAAPFGAAGALLVLALASAAAAQTTTLALDGSMSGGRSDDLAQLQPGPSYTIDETWGTRSGANLFHSFLQFDIGITNGVPDTVTFTADPGQPALANVITRVTGGFPSQIHGNLVVDPATLGAADLYLLNPAGVLFGSASSISVPNSLYLSTAHRLDFAGDPEGSLDLLSDARPDILSMAPPSAFGFEEGGPRAPVLLANAFASDPRQAKTFAVPSGETLSIVAGDLEATGTRLSAAGGRVQIVAVGEAALTVPVDVSQLHVSPGDEGLGAIDLHLNAAVRTLPFATDVPQGTIVIRGGSFELRDRSVAEAGGSIGGSGASIDVETSQSVLIANQSDLRAIRQGDRATGGIDISTGDLRVSGAGSFVRSQVLEFAPAGAAGGDIAIAASGDVRFEGGARLVSETLAAHAGANGAIGIVADEVAFGSGSLVQSSSRGSGVTGGAIAITAGSLSVSDAELSLLAPPGGAPGDLRIDAPGGLVSIEQGALVATEVNGDRPGGNVSIDAGTLQILGSDPDGSGETRRSTLRTATFGSAPGGAIELDVDELRIDAVVVGGQPGRLETTVGPDATGTGGAIIIDAGRVSAAGGGQITSTTDALAIGGPGSIGILAADEVVLDGEHLGDEGLEPSGVFARSQGPGRAGDIRIEAGTIEVLDGARVSSRGDSQLANAGDSGDVDLVARDAIRLVGGINPSVVTARGTVSAPGDVRLIGPLVAGEPGAVERVELLHGGVVDVVNGSEEPGGHILVRAGSLRIEGASGGGIPIPSGLRTETTGLGAAGDITVEVGGDVELLEGGQVTSLSNGAPGAAGSIDVSARRILMSGSKGTAEIEEGSSAAAGDIRYRADELIQLRNGAQLLVRSGFGEDAGTLSLIAPRVELADSSLAADASGFGGTVEIRAAERLVLERARVTALSRGIGGQAPVAAVTQADAPLPAGGNVAISGGAVVLNQSSITADGFGNANGGLIDITADPWLRSGDSSVTASSQFGLQGVVAINTPYGEVTGELAALPENFLDASSLLEEPCLARDAPSGSFAVRPVGRVLAPPDAPLTADPVSPQECSAP